MKPHRRFVDLPWGQMHLAEAGPPRAPAVVLLHQTPRSWTEYQSVIPLLSEHFRVVAIDTPGFGDSDPRPGPVTIEGWAAAVTEVLSHLGVPRAHLVGHHTGGVVAVELAAAQPDLVDRLVLSSTPYTDERFRLERAGRPPIDAVARTADGSHLQELWSRRAGFYPADRPDLLDAFVFDALRVIDTVENGHRAVGSYRMEDRIGRVKQRCLIIRAPDDPFASPHAPELGALLPDATRVDIPGGMVPLPDQLPHEFAAAVSRFLVTGR